MIERKDFDELLERREKEQAARLEQRQQTAYARQGKVDADRLTHDPKWDKFLSHLQPLLEDAEKVLNDCKHNVMAPKLSSEGLTVMRMTGSYAQGRLEAIKEIMDVPRALAAEFEQQREAERLTQNKGHA